MGRVAGMLGTTTISTPRASRPNARALRIVITTTPGACDRYAYDRYGYDRHGYDRYGGLMPHRDSVERFSSVHLHGPVERAVYNAVTLAPSESWTAPEIAVQIGFDELVVGAVLRQFAAAGIVEVEVFRFGARRYRARPTSSFLPERPTSAAIIDPVCGMRVAEDTPFVLADGAATIRFCSQRCVLVWERRGREADAP